MGKTFEFARKYLPKIDPGSVFVEIGSDRGEGSTAYLAQLAKEHQTVLHTQPTQVTGQKQVRWFTLISQSQQLHLVPQVICLLVVFHSSH